MNECTTAKDYEMYLRIYLRNGTNINLKYPPI